MNLLKTLTFRDSIPPIVTLCGSTKFRDEFHKANGRLTCAGKIVLSVGFFMHSEETPVSAAQKRALDVLHFRKIDAADYIYVINVDGYVGASTAREIAYAVSTDKAIDWLDPAAGRRFMYDNVHRLDSMVAAFVTGCIPEL